MTSWNAAGLDRSKHKLTWRMDMVRAMNIRTNANLVLLTTRIESALAHGIVGAAADQGGRDCASQQDRANGVGHDGKG